MEALMDIEGMFNYTSRKVTDAEQPPDFSPPSITEWSDEMLRHQILEANNGKTSISVDSRCP